MSTTEKPSVLLVGADPDSEARVFAALRDSTRIVGSEPAQGERVLAAYRRFSPNVVLVVASSDAEGTFGLVHLLNGAGARVVVVGAVKDPDLILGAMRSGAREFVLTTDIQDLRRAVRAQGSQGGQSGLGQVITVFPAKGGVGATALATNVAGALQRSGHRVCLLDLDFHLGDVLSFLDLPGNYSITDVLGNMKRLDRDLLDTSISQHASGIRVLAQSGKVEEAEHIRGSDVTNLIDFLRNHYDRIVVDGIRGFGEVALAALDASNHVLLVLTQDVPAVRNTQRCVDLFKRLGYQSDRVHLVLNRYQKASRITPDVLRDAVGVPPTHLLSNDFAALIGAINRGQLLVEAAPRSRLTRDVDDLVLLLEGERGRVRTRSGFFRAILGGKEANGSSRTPDQG